MPPDLRGTLGTLLRTTLQQVGVMRDMAMDQARNQRQRLDSALLQRKLRDTLTALGEVVYELAAAGELGSLADHPEIEAQLVELEELERRIDDSEFEPRAPGPLGRRANWPSKAQRAHSSGGRERDPDDGVRVWRPNVDDDDGVVSAFPADEPVTRETSEPARSRKRVMRERPRRANRGGGGITFVDDGPEPEEDLSEYMHEDDVTPTEGDDS